MTPHLSQAARWKGIACLWYGRQAAFVMMVGGMCAGVWLLSKEEDTGWLVPYTLAAGIAWAGIGILLGRCDRK